MGLRTALMSIFYPHTCPMCDKYIGERAVSDGTKAHGSLCDECMQSLPRTEQAALQENSTEMVLWGEVRSKAAARKTMHMDHAAAYLFYEKEQPIQQLVHRMKYSDQPLIGYYLGREAAKEFLYADFFEGIDLIVPMPLHTNRLRSRGYNQSEYIARGLSDVTGIPVDTAHVERIRDTPHQALQRGEERKTNVANAFAVRLPEQLYHKHILIVDDLITTGETMRACLHAMRIIRGARFSIFALCKAR